jgi:DtxR family Mn-dependent transcriptional regulator
MTSVSVQDYLLTIYRLQAEQSPVSTTALAAQLAVTPASVTGMVRKLHQHGLVEYQPYRGVILTQAGEREALRLLRRHRLWERFLTDVLGMSWDEVHEEAHRLEHATSGRVADRLAHFLDEPQSDPHGQPIPARDGTLPARALATLAAVDVGCVARLEEVPDDDPDLLRYLGDLGLYPGARMRVVARASFDGPLIIRVGGAEHPIGQELAKRLLVAPVKPKEEEGHA